MKRFASCLASSLALVALSSASPGVLAQGAAADAAKLVSPAPLLSQHAAEVLGDTDRAGA